MDYTTYLLRANVGIAIFYLCYRCWFKNTSKPSHSRFYLLLTVVMAMVLPLFSFDFGSAQELISLPSAINIEELKGQVSNGASSENAQQIIIGIYCIGFLFTLGRLLLSIYSVQKVKNGSKVVENNECTIYTNPNLNHAFTFVSMIFIPEDLWNSEEKKHVVAHEKIHAKQQHSIEILIMEMLCILFWYNPFVWFIRRELAVIHEFLADEGVLAKGVDRVDYQRNLIENTYRGDNIFVTSNFNHSLIKQRIMTMNNPLKTKKRVVLVTLPITLFILGAFYACSEQIEVLETAPTVEQSTKTSEIPEKIVYIVDGVEQPASFDFNSIDATKVESIDVLKGESIKSLTQNVCDAIVKIEMK